MTTSSQLIQGGTKDAKNKPKLLGNQILGSCIIQKDLKDGFFNPNLGGTGYCSDGFWYDEGVKNPLQRASWYLEPESTTRGGTKIFPDRALVLVTDAAITILDMNNNLDLWMTFIRLDRGAYCHNPAGVLFGTTATHVSYCNGTLLVSLRPDAGSVDDGDHLLIINFREDTVTLEGTTTRSLYVEPDPLTGLLQDEKVYLTTVLPSYNGYGIVLRDEENDLRSIQGIGTWKLWCYTPTPNPYPIYDAGLYDASYSGDMSGSLQDQGNYTTLTIKVGVIEGDNSITYSGEGPVINGLWGPIPAIIGEKVVEVWEGSTLLGSSRSPVSWDKLYHLQTYGLSDGSPVMVGEVPVRVDGTWSWLDNPLPPNVERLYKNVLVRKLDGAAVTDSNFHSIFASWKGGKIYPSDIGLWATTLNEVEETPLRNHLIQTLLRCQSSSGLFPESVESTDGNTLVGGNALQSAKTLYYLLKVLPTLAGTGDLETWVLDSISSGFYALDNLRLESGNFVCCSGSDEIRLIDQVWLYFAFSLGSSGLSEPLSTFCSNRRDSLNVLSLEASGSYPFSNQEPRRHGRSEVLLLHYLFEQGVGLTELQEMLNKFEQDFITPNGVKRFQQDLVGVDSSAYLLYVHLLYKMDPLGLRWKEVLNTAVRMRPVDSGWLGVFQDGLTEELTAVPSLEATALAIMVQRGDLKDNFL